MDSPAKRFSEDYPRLTGLVLREDEGVVENDFSEMAEDTLQRIWHSETFDHSNLGTVDGVSVEVLSPGFWNPGPGPDFMAAEISFEGSGPVVGNVEVELVPSGWRAHGHFDDSAYDDVILLVVLRGNLPIKAPPHTSACVPIPVLALDRRLTGENPLSVPRVSTKFASRVPPSPGLCSKEIEELGPESLDRLLDTAGDWRMRIKAARFQDISTDWGVEEALYRHVLRYLGGQAWGELFNLVARRLPLDLLRRIRNGGSEHGVLRIQAALMGAAGQMPGSSSGVEVGARPYLSMARHLWEEVQNEMHDPWTPLVEKGTSPTRPANSPLRRLAAAGHIIDRLLDGRFLDFFTSPYTQRNSVKKAEALFSV
ncbi:DUF2851 family protein, partial [Candidatus Hydrogenedentota bacterium]